MSWTLTDTYTLVTEECYSCHVLFAMPQDLQHRALEDHSINFYCPNGHGQHYVGKTVEQKLREAERRLASREDDLRFERHRVENERRLHAATKGQLTRARKQVHRAERGVCVHCHRHFVNVERHAASKHPEHTR